MQCTKSYSGTDKIWDHPTEDIAGGHCMIVTGYKLVNGEPTFLIRNSWGESWASAAGRPGHTWFIKDYMTATCTEDIWVATISPELTL